MSCAYQYGRRDDAAAGRDREGERARGDLLAVAVRRHEHVGRREQIGELVDREEAVVELDVRHRARARARAARASAGTARPRGARRRDACARRSCRATSGCRSTIAGSASITVSRPLPGEISPNVESRKRVAAGATGCDAGFAVARRASGEPRRRAVRDDANLLLRAGARGDEQSQRRVGHHDHELRLARTARVSTSAWCGVGSESTVCRVTTSGCASSSRERQHVLAVAAAEDPVLVLEQHDVDVEPPEHPGGADVVAADGLRDRREQPAPLRARRLVDDRDEIGALDVRRRRAAFLAGRRRTCRSRTPAADRWRRSPCACAQPRGRVSSHAGCVCIRWGCCRPPRTDVGLRSIPSVAARRRSRTRFRLFLMMSLPLVTPRSSKRRARAGVRTRGR